MLDWLVSMSILLYALSLLLGTLILFVLRIQMIYNTQTAVIKKLLVVFLPASLGVCILTTDRHKYYRIYMRCLWVVLSMQVLGSFYVIYTYIA